MEKASQVISRALTGIKEPKTTPEIMTSIEFDFQTLGDPILEKILAESKRFASSLLRNDKPHWISFLGKSGNGKTFIARQLYRFWRKHFEFYTAANGATLTRLGRFAKWRDVHDKLLNGEWDIKQACAEVDFLVLDDIGAERDKTGITSEALDYICDARAKKWTVITANKGLGDIAEVDTRIASRMLRDGNVVVPCNAKDFNLRKISGS